MYSGYNLGVGNTAQRRKNTMADELSQEAIRNVIAHAKAAEEHLAEGVRE